MDTRANNQKYKYYKQFKSNISVLRKDFMWSYTFKALL